MSRRPLHTVKCPCGETFETTSPNGHYCARCRTVRKKIIERHHEKVRHGSERRDKISENVERDYLAAIGKSETENNARTRCKFCGRTTKSGREFCHDCVHNGLDAVYALTGRSNGWDRRGQGAQNVQPGWRGQKVAGCRAYFRRAE